MNKTLLRPRSWILAFFWAVFVLLWSWLPEKLEWELKKIIKTTLHLLARNLNGQTSLRPVLHRLRGVKIYGEVVIGDDVYIDPLYPDHVEIHDGAVIAARCTIIAGMKGPGKIIIGKQAAIGAGCMITCSVGQTLTIGEGSVISAGSIVGNDIPPHTLCGPPRIKAFAKVTVPLTKDQDYEGFRRGLRPIRAANGKQVSLAKVEEVSQRTESASDAVESEECAEPGFPL